MRYFFVVFLLLFYSLKLEAKSFAQKVTIDSTGAGVAIWVTSMPSYNAIIASTYSSSGVWSTATQISPVNEDCSYPLLVTNSAGNSVTLWSTFDTNLNIRVLKAATLPFGGSWSSPVMISSISEDVASFPNNMSDSAYRIVMNDSGIIMAIWDSYIGNDLVIRSARFSGGSWSTPITISP